MIRFKTHALKILKIDYIYFFKYSSAEMCILRLNLDLVKQFEIMDLFNGSSDYYHTRGGTN